MRALQARPDRFRTLVCVTAQHREMLDQVLAAFDLAPDIDLDLMAADQTLAGLTARVLEGLHGVFEAHAADWVIVQGDTTTTMAGALCAYYHQVKVAHVEAGLRTDNKYQPFPEEINRRLASQIADLHFAPTERARQNLLRDGVDPARVFVTGNTVIDALLAAREKIAATPPSWPGLDVDVLGGRRVVLITGHRRENFGAGFRAICEAIRALAEQFPAVAFVYPVHLNPNVRGPVFGALADVPNIHLIAPLDYLPFVALMERASIILTDSGGVQEEAPALGKPVLVMRETTERPEAIEAGTAKLVGTGRGRIAEEAARLLTGAAAYAAMSQAKNPYGDGTAAQQIAAILAHAAAE